MCYLIAKHIDKVGCIALKTAHGKHLSEFKRDMDYILKVAPVETDGEAVVF